MNDALAVPMSRRNEVFAAIRKNDIYKHNIEMMKSTEYELLIETTGQTQGPGVVNI